MMWVRRINYIRYAEGVDVERVLTIIDEAFAAVYTPDVLAASTIRTFEQEQEENYKSDLQLVGQIGVFSLISILISLMGIVGLVYFEMQYRRQEIVIRRVMGASISGILRMVNRKFIVITTICFVVTLPISYYIIDRLLTSYAYRTAISPLIFVAIYAAVAAVVAAIVTAGSYNTANQNPANLIGKNV